MNKIIFTLTSLFVFTSTVFAHSGGTNSAGCHHDRKNGGYHCHRSNSQDVQSRAVSSEDYEVAFNQKTRKIHRPGCKSAKSCTVNCVTIMKSEAIRRNGVACGNCGS